MAPFVHICGSIRITEERAVSEQRVILVTGATSGIGAAIASRLAADGNRVFGTGRNATGETSGGVTLLPLDVRSDDSVRRTMQDVMTRADRIDVLINNAGYLLAGACEEVSLEQAKDEFETNFFGTVRMVNAVLPAMRKRKSGRIINVSSLAGVVALPFWGFYNASKFAVEGYTESLRLDLKPFGIRVTLIEPGTIKTAFYRQPTVATMPEYARWRDRAMKTLKEFEERAPGPDVVAKAVSNVVRSKSPPFRVKITREAHLLPFLKRILPDSLMESTLRAAYKLD
jgi:NAD(P)-dependent dehydrogenase (short-subunit alcohol dehydrogenase family)